MRPKREDTALAVNPDIGRVAQRVRAVCRKGGVYLSAETKNGHEAKSVVRVSPEDVLGVMARRLA
ncbi:hypothetical protein [uncultured Erythrobacter sp.]|uniref:hypothetical protein n=1 Tax=uncultured Erythrobacter sp. TaxID=263913 RepID=UPI0026095B4B|nr:hypothetical protein [uncultured Erythrobacter sp.]